MEPRPDPTAFLPLTPVAFEILLALAGGAAHGYAVLQEIERRTAGRVSPHAGTLYRALARMVADGWLAELEGRGGEGDDERRRTYRLTELGEAVAAAEARRLEALVASARDRKLLAPRRA